MSDWDNMLAADAPVFINTFGESVTYNPRGGAARPITAIVDRMPPASGPGGMRPRLTIQVLNSATAGITPDEWRNGDTLTVAERRGGDTELFQIHWPGGDGAHDAGLITFWLS